MDIKKNQNGFAPTPKFGITSQNERGFVLIALLLAIIIIAVITVSLLTKSNDGKKQSLPEIKNQAKVDTNKINQNLQNYQQQINIQNN